MKHKPIRIKCDLNVRGADTEAKKDLDIPDPDDQQINKILGEIIDEEKTKESQPEASGTSLSDHPGYSSPQ